MGKKGPASPQLHEEASLEKGLAGPKIAFFEISLLNFIIRNIDFFEGQ